MEEKGVEFRQAVRADLERIVEMLADDVLGKERERFEQPLSKPSKPIRIMN